MKYSTDADSQLHGNIFIVVPDAFKRKALIKLMNFYKIEHAALW